MQNVFDSSMCITLVNRYYRNSYSVVQNELITQLKTKILCKTVENSTSTAVQNEYNYSTSTEYSTRYIAYETGQ
jgi:hypothetical protein